MPVRSNIVGIDSPEALEKALRAAYYLADEAIATASYLGSRLASRSARGRARRRQDRSGQGDCRRARPRLIRLQCYEGIDAAAALYEWNYPRQMLAIRQAGEASIDIYGEILDRAADARGPAPPDLTVLLIDEIDRADQEFEAFLLEFLSDFQIFIPERGTLRAAEHPVVS